MGFDFHFIAMGSVPGWSSSRSAFSTWHVSIWHADVEYGVNVHGRRCGVFGESIIGDGNMDSEVEGVGVQGTGENFGVFGNGNRGIAGVFGENNRGRVGVLGTTMRGGTGVAGLSMENLGNPLGTFSSDPKTLFNCGPVRQMMPDGILAVHPQFPRLQERFGVFAKFLNAQAVTNRYVKSRFKKLAGRTRTTVIGVSRSKRSCERNTVHP